MEKYRHFRLPGLLPNRGEQDPNSHYFARALALLPPASGIAGEVSLAGFSVVGHQREGVS